MVVGGSTLDTSGFVKVLNKKILRHYLTTLRNKKTSCIRFREVIEKVGLLMAYEIAENLEIKEIEIDTPIANSVKGEKLFSLTNTTLVGILRAGLHMVMGALRVLEGAKVGFVSAKRLENSSSRGKEFEVRIDYVNVPNVEDEIIIIMDPMLATGSTLVRVIEKLLDMGRPKMLILASIISTPIAISRVLSRYRDMLIYTVAIDEKLNDRGFIVPGLGDAGDRLYNCE